MELVRGYALSLSLSFSVCSTVSGKSHECSLRVAMDVAKMLPSQGKVGGYGQCLGTWD